jgi:uncharacterized coiled-coil protein SlyX
MGLRWLLQHLRGSQQDLNAIMLERITTLERREEKGRDTIEALMADALVRTREAGDLRAELRDLQGQRDLDLARIAELEALRAQDQEQLKLMTCRITELESDLAAANKEVKRLREERRIYGIADSEASET